MTHTIDQTPQAAELEGAGAPDGKVSVVIAEDAADIADLLELALSRAGFDVVGMAVNGVECIELTERLQPEIVVLDLHMPEMGGLEALPLIGEVSPRTKVVVHSAIGATFMTESTLRAGAVAYIQKGVSPRSIVKHIQRVAHAGAVSPVRPFPLNREYSV